MGIKYTERYNCIIKWKKQKNTTVGRGPKSNRKIVERGKNDTPNTQIHVHDLSLKTLKSS
jgi:hypothetical protein